MLQKIKLIIATIVGVFLFYRFRKSPTLENINRRNKLIKEEVTAIKDNIKQIDNDIAKVDSKIESLPDDENWHLKRDPK